MAPMNAVCSSSRGRATPLALGLALLLTLSLCAPVGAASAPFLPEAPRCPMFPVSNVWNKPVAGLPVRADSDTLIRRSEEHTSELQSQSNLVCRLLLEKKKTNK